MQVKDLIIIQKIEFLLLKKKISRLLNRQSLLPRRKLLSRLWSFARQLQAFTEHFLLAEKKILQTIMIPTLPEVFVVFTLKLLDSLLLTRNTQL